MGANCYFMVTLMRRRPNINAYLAPGLKGTLVGVMLLSCLWEITEFYMEAGYAHPWLTHWFQGIEHPLNRFVSDPLMMLVGALAASRSIMLIVPIAARLASLAWLYVHLFVLQHSMELQEMLDKFIR